MGFSLGLSRKSCFSSGLARSVHEGGMTRAPHPADPSFDVQRRFIRIVREHDNGMVEFEFAVAEPELFVEMVMPREQFDDFCQTQAVAPTHGRLPEPTLGSDEGEWDWSLQDARAQHFRGES